MRQLFDDGDMMPPSWKEWLKMAEEMEQGLKAYAAARRAPNSKFGRACPWGMRSFGPSSGGLRV
jgi:hypothetical protein